MISKDKSLTTNESFFKRVVNFFKKLFKKEKISNVEVENISVKDESFQNQEIPEKNITIYPDMFDEEGMPKAQYLSIILDKVKEDLEKNQESKISYQKSDEEKTEEARKFFELYDKIKNNEINPKDVDPIDIIKVNRMFQEEIKIHKEKFGL